MKLFGDMPYDGSMSGFEYAWPVLVNHFVKDSYYVDTRDKPNMHTHVFARVSWFCHHPSKHPKYGANNTLNHLVFIHTSSCRPLVFTAIIMKINVLVILPLVL